MTDTETIADNVARVLDRIADACICVNRDPAGVMLVTGGKTQPVCNILAKIA